MNKNLNICGIEVPWFFVAGVAVLALAVAGKLVFGPLGQSDADAPGRHAAVAAETTEEPTQPAENDSASTTQSDDEPTVETEASQPEPSDQDVAALEDGTRIIDEMHACGIRVRQRVKATDTDAPISHGEYQTWYGNGNRRSQGQHRDGKREGRWTFWDDGGRLLSHQTYVGGLPHGPFVVYHPGGEKAREGELSRGMKHGLWTYRDEQGREIRQERYDRGTPTGQWVHRDSAGEVWAAVQR